MYGYKFVGGMTKMFPTETESARLLLSYKIDLVSVEKGLENITCINMAYFESIYVFLWLYEWFN